MSEDEIIRREQGARLAKARIEAGYSSAREAALSNSWPESSYRAHENGGRTIDYDDAERYSRRFRSLGARISGRQIMYGDDPAPKKSIADSVASTVIISGQIGAGAEITPDAEQVPPEGLEQIEVPFAVEPGTYAFIVRGMSMYPAYKPEDVILCGREIFDPINMIGKEAAVQTIDGRRYLKTIHRGSSPGVYDLESFNAPMIRGVKLEWAAGVDLVIRRSHWKSLDRAAQTNAYSKRPRRTTNKA